MINVTKAFLPSVEAYNEYVKGIWERGQLTNHGPLVVELEGKLKSYLGVKHFLFVANGTIALQLAIKALDLRGEIITTSFSYVATTSSIVWENAHPVFVDIDPETLTIDSDKIVAAITDKTSAILATHVYGIPCDVEAIDMIARKHRLKVIYDAAHSFGVRYNDQSVLNYGDISTLSFHATKLFHTVEGGGVATNDDDLAHRLSYLRNFGHNGQEKFWGLGINGKNSEFHAAMGLCVLPHVADILAKRRKLSELYDLTFMENGIRLRRPKVSSLTNYNYAYFPVVFENEDMLIGVRDQLNKNDIFPRRYFYPSLNTLPFITHPGQCQVAESIASRVLCLPLHHDLSEEEVHFIVSKIAEYMTK